MFYGAPVTAPMEIPKVYSSPNARLKDLAYQSFLLAIRCWTKDYVYKEHLPKHYLL